MANAVKSETPILDALVQLQDLGVELHSDGETAWIDWRDRQLVPPELSAVVRQCSHQLGRMIGDKQRAAP
jgi:hypothetical protein